MEIKGEKKHKLTEDEDFRNLFENLKKIAKDKTLTIINESPDPVGDSVKGLEILKSMTN